MLGISGNSVAVEFKGSQVKDITKKELNDEGLVRFYSLTDGVKGLADTLQETVNEFQGVCQLTHDANALRDLAGNLKVILIKLNKSGDGDPSLVQFLNDSIESIKNDVRQLPPPQTSSGPPPMRHSPPPQASSAMPPRQHLPLPRDSDEPKVEGQEGTTSLGPQNNGVEAESSTPHSTQPPSNDKPSTSLGPTTNKSDRDLLVESFRAQGVPEEKMRAFMGPWYKSTN